MNTRIYPTPNGLPHLGHVYMTLVNQYHARSTGGKLAIIFDDTQPCWIESVGRDGLERFAGQWIEDMEWMGITFDTVLYQSREHERFTDWLDNVEYDGRLLGEAHDYAYKYNPNIAYSDVGGYPWEDWLTVEKVYMDALAGVNMVIRGEDLLCEFALYQSMWCKYIGTEPPEHVYLPRLRAQGMDALSKTEGNHKLREYREMGYKPQAIEWMLRQSCLDDKYGEWDWRNVKRSPKLIRDKMPVMYAVPLNWRGE